MTDRPRLRTSAATAWANWMLPRLLRSGCAALRNCGGKVAGKATGGDTTLVKGLSGFLSARAPALRTPPSHNGLCIMRKLEIFYNLNVNFAHNTVMRIKKTGGKQHLTKKSYEQAPVGAASRVAARTGTSRRRGVCAHLLLPAQYAAGRILTEKLFTAAAAGRATTLAENGISAPRCAPPAALAAPGAGEAARLRARGRGTPPAGGTATPANIRQE